MYSYIKGKIVEKNIDSIIVENSGIGYHINSSLGTIGQLSEENCEVKLFTNLYIREDIFSLYGFLTRDELKMFLLLISVSGVGPKAALSIMSNNSPSRFSLSVITDDSSSLTKAQGIGKKLAQRIILELKDKVKKETLENSLLMNHQQSQEIGIDKNINEAIDALLVLGYSRDSAFNAVKSNYCPGIEIETLIKNALKSLAR